MKISETLAKKINDQVNAEQYSAMLYLSMSIELEARNLKGMASWMWEQHLEELGHSYEMIHYLQSRGAKPAITAVEQPATEFGTPMEIFETALAHEERVSARIHDIVKQTIEEADYGAENFFRKYVTEQEEEESTFADIVERMKVAGEHGIVYTDKRLGKRAVK